MEFYVDDQLLPGCEKWEGAPDALEKWAENQEEWGQDEARSVEIDACEGDEIIETRVFDVHCAWSPTFSAYPKQG